jgi:hypothetical protein
LATSLGGFGPAVAVGIVVPVGTVAVESRVKALQGGHRGLAPSLFDGRLVAGIVASPNLLILAGTAGFSPALAGISLLILAGIGGVSPVLADNLTRGRRPAIFYKK